MVNLIAHKGYYQMRQYRLNDLDEQYRQKMEQLRDHTDMLLRNLTQAAVTVNSTSSPESTAYWLVLLSIWISYMCHSRARSSTFTGGVSRQVAALSSSSISIIWKRLRRNWNFW